MRFNILSSLSALLNSRQSAVVLFDAFCAAAAVAAAAVSGERWLFCADEAGCEGSRTLRFLSLSQMYTSPSILSLS